MSIISQTPVYNLSAVLKETGLKADVLRAWERRYDLPKPQRTAGGHRLYSEFDIEMIKWLRARQAEGLTISRAVELWKEHIADGRDPLLDNLLANVEVNDTGSFSNKRIEILRNSWLEACLDFDGNRAEDILNQAFAMYPVEVVCSAILQRGMSMIGDFWHSGEASVQQEHFASALAVRRLETLIAATPQPTRTQTVVVGCPVGEWHTFPVLLFTLFLRRKGLKVVYLGADNPAEQMVETAEAIRPNLIILSAQRLTTAASLLEAVEAFQERSFTIAYGGLIFNRISELRERIPAVFLGESLDEAMLLAEQLLAAPASVKPAACPDSSSRIIARLYREKRPFVEMALLRKMQENDWGVGNLEEANSYFGNGLFAALELGSPAYMEADLHWVKRWFKGQLIPADSLNFYLKAYAYAVRLEMGEEGTSIVQWIEDYVVRNKIQGL